MRAKGAAEAKLHEVHAGRQPAGTRHHHIVDADMQKCPGARDLPPEHVVETRSASRDVDASIRARACPGAAGFGYTDISPASGTPGSSSRATLVMPSTSTAFPEASV